MLADSQNLGLVKPLDSHKGPERDLVVFLAGITAKLRCMFQGQLHLTATEDVGG